ncbi:pilus assembly protein PilP [Halomonas binhaiensis]|uniref:Pilus assembly protein PilP n=1 Tax=Halomonas binhaiensis TaxID=2562282 RepID=A0A5C1NDD9_9GAMM|nr:pilus assembly protein PilP [Halomonas binhaiensis]QEM80673.1 pilus assembly protein PilP [Halomonas binhaiensis]
MTLAHEWQRLKECDWRSLELSEAGSWPWVLRGLLVVVVLALVLGTVLWVDVVPLYGQLESARQKQDRLAQGQSEAQLHREQLQFELRVLERQLVELMVGELRPQADAIPVASKSSRLFLAEVSQLAQQYHLAIDTMSLGAPDTQEQQLDMSLQVDTQAFSLSVRGGFHDLAGFVAGLTRLSGMPSLDDFTVEGEGDALRLSAEGHAYHLAGPYSVTEFVSTVGNSSTAEAFSVAEGSSTAEAFSVAEGSYTAEGSLPIERPSHFLPLAYRYADRPSPFGVFRPSGESSPVSMTLQDYPPASISLVGTLVQGERRWALVSTPDKKVWRVKVGDSLGRGANQARVMEIGKAYLHLKGDLFDQQLDLK